MKQLTYDERREIFSAKCSVKPRELELFYKALEKKKNLKTADFVKRVFFDNAEKYDNFRASSFIKALDTFKKYGVRTNHCSDWGHIRTARFWVYNVTGVEFDFPSRIEIHPFLTKKEAEAFLNGCFHAKRHPKEFTWKMTSDYDVITSEYLECHQTLNSFDQYETVKII